MHNCGGRRLAPALVGPADSEHEGELLSVVLRESAKLVVEQYVFGCGACVHERKPCAVMGSVSEDGLDNLHHGGNARAAGKHENVAGGDGMSADEEAAQRVLELARRPAHEHGVPFREPFEVRPHLAVGVHSDEQVQAAGDGRLDGSVAALDEAAIWKRGGELHVLARGEVESTALRDAQDEQQHSWRDLPCLRDRHGAEFLRVDF
mmetsp:Transcript_21735/g.64088  ORF Transcript_21735/g.64088 Transcript_21735/m.64088 type:complete len:206 (-) Transcript_21735:164-781(-)